MLTNFPNGITSFGVPVTGPAPISVPNGNGKVIYVSVDGQVGPPGAGVEITTTSIQTAINACTSGAGDTILVFPGTYDENLTIDGIDYVTIIGCQIGGYERPDVGAATGSAITITNSQGVVIRHMRFFNDDDSDVAFIDGNGFIFDDCVFDGNGNMTADAACLALNASDTDNSYTASEGVVQNCLFRGSAAIGIRLQSGAAPASGVGPTHNVVANNRFVGITDEDIKTVDGGTATYITQDSQFSGNQHMDANKTVYITMSTVAADTGIISGNFFAHATITATEIDVAGTDVIVAGNFDAAGVIDGSTFN